MCGIVGFYFNSWHLEKRQQAAEIAAKSIASRGPDDSGVWAEPKGLTFGHRRLSILDLSPLGHQPMISNETGNVIAYNGEIYNFQEIRSELEQEGLKFRSTGDTEVLLKAIDYWGLEKTLPKCNGMFALAVWLEKERVLQIARDRIGIKPLYYGWCKEGFVFSSELKALYALEDFKMPLSKEALSLFFEHGYITAPYSIFKGIYKLIPGCTLSLNESILSQEPDTFSPFSDSSSISPKRYWSVPKQLPSDINNYDEGLTKLEELLASSVKLRTIADVPVGAFLSGGIDSSVVAAMMQNSGEGSVKTFSIGFEEQGFNEAPYAKEIAKHLSTDHTELYLSAKESLDVIPELANHYDEPFASSSQIPTILVSRLARKSVTVSLSGDGGDELFRGYTRYPIATGIWNKLKWCPMPVRSILSAAIQTVPMHGWNSLYKGTQPILPASLKGIKYMGLKMHRLSEVMNSKSLGELYCTANTHWRPDYHPVEYIKGNTVLSEYNLEKDFKSAFDYLSYLDLNTYITDDILTKVDRASMSCSLEARVPLLDHRIIEFSRSIPSEWCIQGGTQKKILRDVLEKYVPRSLYERPKTGFGIPLPHWLRGELKEWGESLLTESALPADDILNRTLILEKWKSHQTKRIDFHYPLWNVLQFQAWRKYWKTNISA